MAARFPDFFVFQEDPWIGGPRKLFFQIHFIAQNSDSWQNMGSPLGHRNQTGDNAMEVNGNPSTKDSLFLILL